MEDSAGKSCFDLTGRVALVTGGSSGIGAHIAEQLALSGARVVLAARRAEQLNEVKNRIEALGGVAGAVTMDVTDEASTINAYDAAEQLFGPVDTVIANAGMNSAGSALGLDMTGFDQTVAVNLRGVFLTVREGARRMVSAGSAESGRGRVLIMSSMTAKQVSPGLAVYSATKAAVNQLGRVLARDWAGKGINVNMLAPGYIATDLNDGYFDHPAGQRLMSTFARQRTMPLASLSEMALYLCSDASAFTTGAVMMIDDGQSLT